MLFIVCVIFRNIILKSGMIEWGDLWIPYNLPFFRSMILTTWNEWLSYPSWQTLSSSTVLYPLVETALLLNISSDWFLRLLLIFAYFISGVSMYFACYILLKDETRVVQGNYWANISAIIAGIVYMVNPWSFYRFSQYIHLFGYAVTPLALVFFIKLLDRRKIKYKYVIFISLLWCIASASVHFIVFIGFLLFSYLAYKSLIDIRKKEFFKLSSSVKSSLLILILYILFSSYWLIPYLVGSSTGSITLPYVVTPEIIQMLSRGSSLINVIRLMGFWDPVLGSYPTTDLIIPWTISTFIISIFAFSAIILYKKNKHVLFFSLLAILFILLSTGTAGPLGEWYTWMIFNLPFISKIEWVFRESNKFVGLLALCYSFLTGFTILKLSRYRFNHKYVFYLTIFVLLSSILLASWQFLTGNFNGPLEPKIVPKQIIKMQSFINSDAEQYRVFWSPVFGAVTATWNDNKITELFYLYLTDKGSFPLSFFYYRNFVYRDLLVNNKTLEFGKYIGFTNTKYVILHDDVADDRPWYIPGESGKVLTALRQQKDLELIKQESFIYIFENSVYANHTSIPQQRFAILGGLEKFASLNAINSFSPVNSSVFFMDQTNQKNIYQYTANSDGIVLNKNIFDFVFLFSNINYEMIKPSEYTNYHDPGKFWSKALTSDPLHAEWHPYLEQFGMENWEFDYSEGLVLTSAKQVALEIPLNVKKSDNYKLLIRYFENQKGGLVRVFLDDKQILINTTDQLDKFVWGDIADIYLTEGQHKLTLENADGFNAVNLFVLLPSEELIKIENQTVELLKDKRAMYVFEPEYDTYYNNSNKSGKYDGEASNGKVLELKPDSKVWTDFEIFKPSEYKITLRFVGNITLNLDGDNYSLSSSNLNWTDVSQYLEKGVHSIKITTKDSADLDVIWIYSIQEKDETLENIFTTNEIPATILEYKKVDSTEYIAKINASKPFALSFAEAYDPLWEARVYRDGKMLESVEPTPIYDVINGFWVNDTGNLDIVIRYKPQDYFEIGLIIFGITLAACLLYIFYDWRRN